MSNNVDRRVVEMQFDNKDFENNIQDSVKSLDKLKKSLDLEESAKGLSALEKAGRHFSLDGMVEAAEAVTSKFSIMGTIGDQVLRRIGDAAFNALNKMKGFVDSLTIEPISTGLQEYETQINSIQTILSNTYDDLSKKGYATEADRVAIINDRLDTLNHYADKTIYNFTQMTESIGRFTAAGVDLDTSVAAIQGIANLAAVSGSNADQASNAMYMLSQAMSAGTVTAYQWNSVMRAGMGGEVFQKAILRNAKAMGKTIDVTVEEVDAKGKKVKKTVQRTVQEIVDEMGFKESLSKGWFTSDILAATLDQFSWDFEEMAKNSGYTKENLEEGIAAMKELKRGELLAQGFTPEEADEMIRLAEDATNAATKVKTFTQLFDTLKEAAQSGWTETWRYIIGDFEEAKVLLTGISDFFGEVIGASAEARNKIMKEWHDNGGRDMLFNNDPNKGALGAFWNLVYGIQNIVGLIREEFNKIFPPATSQALLSFTEKIQQATARFKAFTEDSDQMDKIRRIVAGIASGFGIVKDAIGFIWQGFKKLLGFVPSAAGGLLDFAAGIGDSIVKMRESLKTSEAFQNFLQRVGAVGTKVRGLLVSAFNAIKKAFSSLWGKIKSSGILTKIGEGISNFVGKIPGAIDKVKDWVKSIIEYVKNSELLQKAWSNVKNFFEPMLKNINDFGKRLKEALKAFFNKDVSGEENLWDKLKARLSAFGGAFSDWFGTVKSTVSNVWTKIKDFLSNFFTKTIPDFFNSKKLDASSILEKVKAVDWGKILKTVLGVATFVEILKAVRNFSKIGKIADSFNNLTKTVKGIAKNGASLTKDGLFINGKQKSPIADTLLKVAASIGILVASIYVLAKMDSKSIMKGMGLLTLLTTELLVVSALFSKMDLDGGSVLKASAAILLLVIPIKLLSAMKTADALKGIIGVGLILAELALFSRMMGKDFNGKQAGFIGLGIAVNLLVVAIKSLSKLNVGSMAKSLIAMEVLLLEMAAFTKRVSGKKVAGMIAMAIGINLMVTAVKRMGKLDTKTIAKGVIGLGSIMLAFGTMLKLSGGVNLGSALILLVTMAGSLLMFTEAFKRIDGSNTNDMLKFSVSFAAMMTSMSIALKVLSTIPIVGALKGVANMAILVVGLGALVVGLGYLQSQWQGMTDFLEGGGNVLGQIGRAIGKFVGGIGAGIVEGLSLPQLGSDLSAFMENSKGFIEGAKSVDTSAATGVGNLTAAIIKIAGAEFVSALVSLFAGDNPVTKFSKDLVTLGQGLSAYALSVLPLAIVPQAILDRSIAVASALADVAKKIPATGGVMTLLTGIGDMGNFGDSITSLGKGLASFALEISAIEDDKFNQKKVDALIAVATGLATLESNLEGQGGLEDAIVGVQSLATFSEGFTPFATGLNAFITEVKAINYDPKTDGEKMTAVIAIATSLSELEKNLQGQNGLAQAITGVKSLYAFGQEIPDFAEGLNGFITEVKAIVYDTNADDTKLYAVISIATALATLEKNLQGQNGLEQAITGIKSLEEFGNKVEPFAEGLNGFITEVKAIEYDPNSDDAKLSAVIAIAKTLSEFEKTLEAQGGWADSILGTKDLGQFAGNIKVLGEAVASYMKDIQGVNTDDNNATVSALQVIQDFTEGLDPSGSIWDTLNQVFGEGSKFNTLLTYTSSMKKLGADLEAFATSIENVSSEKVNYATEIFGVMQTFIEGLESSGAIWDWFGETFGSGSKFATLTKVAGEMATFGTKFKTFTDGISGADVATTQFESTRKLFEAFRTFNNDLTGSGNMQISTMYQLLDVVEECGYSMATFSEGMGNISLEDLNTAASVINTIVMALETANSIPDLSIDPIQELLNNFSQITIPEFDTEGMESAKAFINSLTEGIGGAAALTSITTSITGLSGQGTTAAEGTYKTWYSSGQYLAAGLGAGINSMASTVRQSAVNVAAGAIRSIRMTWSVNSPSKVGEDLGMYFDLGIAGGLDNYAKVVSGSAVSMGKKVVDSASTMLRGVDGSIFDNLDPNPTIRPVMDLTNIQNGVSAINGMFNPNNMQAIGLFRGMNLTRGINQLNLDGGRITGTITDKNIVSNLEGLQTKIEELGEAVTNMKLVLDTGALVGGTSAKMDNELGTLAMRRGRGN
mgnify:CR=1 FL=1